MDPSLQRSIDSLSQEAITLAKCGDLEGATVRFQRALGLAPNRPDLLNNLGYTLFQRGHPEEALGYYEKALAIEPGYPDALHNKGNYLGHSKRYAEAILCFVDALLIDPNRVEILYTCGFSHLMLGNLLTASCIFTRVGELDPNRRNDRSILNYLGYVIAILGKNKASMENLDAALSDSTNDTSMYLRARLKLAQGDRLVSLQLLEKVIDRDSAFKAVALNDPQFQPLLFGDAGFRELLGLTRQKSAFDFIQRLISRAAARRERKDCKSAMRILDEVLDRQRTLVGDHFIVAQTLQSLAELHLEAGELEKGGDCFRRQLDIMSATRGGNSLEYIDALQNCANALRQIGDFERTLILLERAIVITRRALGFNPNFASLLTDTAILHLDMDRYQETETLYQEALEFERANPSQDRARFITSLNNLAGLYRRVGNYREAESTCKQAVAVARERLGSDHLELARSLENLALFYMSIGEDKKSLPLLRQNAAIIRRKTGNLSPEFLEASSVLAHALSLVGQLKKAESIFNRTIRMYEKNGRRLTLRYSGTLSNLAGVYQKMRKYRKAEQLYRQAMEIYQKQGEDFFSSLVGLDLGGLYRARHEYDRAEPLYIDLIKRYQAKLGSNHPDLITFFTGLAGLYDCMDKPDKAMALLDLVAKKSDRIIRVLLGITSDDQRIAYLSRIRSSVELYISLVLQRYSQSKAHKAKALELVFKRKGIGFEAARTQREVLIGKHDAVAEKLKELRNLQNEIGMKTISGPGRRRPMAHVKFLTELNSRKDLLEAELGREVSEAELEEKFQVISLASIASVIPEGSVLVEFFEVNTGRDNVERHYIAFVLHRGAQPEAKIIDIGKTDVIDGKIDAYRKAVMDIAPDSQTSEERSIGRTLRAMVFDPLVSSFGDVNQLLIAPDGNLILLPIEILPTASGGRVIDDYSISYLGTGRDLLLFGRSAGGSVATEPVVIADPDFDLDRSTKQDSRMTRKLRRSLDFSRGAVGKFERLGGTRDEGREVAELLGVVPWMDENALEGKVKALVSPLILHVASHAFFLQNQKPEMDDDRWTRPALAEEKDQNSGLRRFRELENPLLRSGIALTGANLTLRGKAIEDKDAEDGILTAEDVVSGMDLSATELVVLSACETGLGQVEVGEGLFGLRRSFGLAGAKTLIMSMWRVDDTVSKQVMVCLYRNLVAGQGCAQALRNAQLATKKQYPMPYFWGAFVCHGNPARIAMADRSRAQQSARPAS